MNKVFHQSVLIKEILSFLKVKAEGKYIDATIGGGGVTGQILERGGQVLGIDWDDDAINFLRKKFAREISKKRLILEKENFAKIAKLAKKHKFLNCDGVIFDLGVSTYQLKTPQRGFSFAKSGPLDMRMSKSLKVLATDLLAVLTAKELERLFLTFGVQKAAKIATEIVKRRVKKPIATTQELARIVGRIVKGGRIDPATKVFLALRAAVNFELENLKTVLPSAVSVLAKNGRLLVISFHSAEDAIVKKFLAQYLNLAVLTDKPVRPKLEEILTNPAARSARLRVAVKIN